MVSYFMDGPYLLTESEIDEQVSQYFPGNLVLSRSENNTFTVNYVGRSDTYLNQRLKLWADGKYKRFKYIYADSPKSAYENECIVYHTYGEKEKLDNNSHPQQKEGFSWNCPVCSK